VRLWVSVRRATELLRIVLATANSHKVQEIRDALRLPGIVLETLREHPEVEPVEETGESFEENARLKSERTAQATGLLSLADDSGLEVEALGGAPGLRSARFAGENASDAENRRALVNALRGKGEPPFRARFVCVLLLASPEGRVRTFEGRCPGEIYLEERGCSGFGYDPLFVPEGFAKTFAEMAIEQKREISHRGRALRALERYLRGLMTRESYPLENQERGRN
jgi:XTP/dITP diphosphohydrolase